MADVAHGHTENERDRETRVHDDAAVGDGVVLGEVVIEVILIRVQSEQREPGVIRFIDGASQRMLIHITDLEIFKVISQAGLMNGHGLTSRRGLHIKV